MEISVVLLFKMEEMIDGDEEDCGVFSMIINKWVIL